MSTTQTKWEVELVDKVTKPMRDVVIQAKKTTDVVDELQESVEEIVDTLTDGAKDIDESLEDVSDGLEDVEDKTQKVTKASGKWTDMAMGFNQISELINKVADSLAFANDIVAVQNNIERMTGMQGDVLEETIAKVHKLGYVYKENDDEIARSANAMSEQLKITYDEALRYIETGFQKGANINGDMLDQLKEYGPQIQELGLSASDMIAIMAKAGQKGIMTDKAIDSIKEANLSIKEMGQTQIEALAGIGLSVQDLAGKTSWEAVQMISKAMEGATAQAKQLALTDIFKGAGEDAGMSWVLGLNSIDLDVNNIPSVQQSGSSIRAWMADVQTWIATSLGGATEYIQTFAMAAVSINSVIGIMQTLKATQIGATIATKAATLATTVWNAALWANPITWVVAILGGLIAAVIYFSDKVEWCGGVVEVVSETWKDWGGVILDYLLYPLKQVWGVLEGIWKLLNGDFSGAMKSFSDPAMDMVNSATNAYDKTIAAYNTGTQNVRNKKAEDDASIYLTDKNTIDGKLGAPKIDGKISAPKGGGSASTGNSKISNGLSGSGGGNKALTMNLTINNHFSNVKSDLDIRTIADKVAGVIVDRVRDASFSLG